MRIPVAPTTVSAFTSRGCGRVAVSHTHPFCTAVYHVKETGWEKVHGLDVNDIHYEFQEEKAAAAKK
jgi:hypothetical protein